MVNHYVLPRIVGYTDVCACVHEFGFRKQTSTMNSGNAEYLCWPNIRGGDVERINGVDDNDYSRNCLPFGNSQRVELHLFTRYLRCDELLAGICVRSKRTATSYK